MLCKMSFTCRGPAVGLFVCRPVDELAQAGHSVGADQSVAAESPAVHHSDVQRRVQQLILRQILTHKIHDSLDQKSQIKPIFILSSWNLHEIESFK